MKTNLEQEVEKRNLPLESSLDDIALNATIIPLRVVDENNETCEIIFAESMSGGADEVENMPKSLTLTKLKMIDDELHTFTANYILNYSK